MTHTTERTAYTLVEFAKRAGIGLSTAYEAIRAGRLKATKLGRKTLVTADAEREFLSSLPGWTPSRMGFAIDKTKAGPRSARNRTSKPEREAVE